MYSQGCTYSTNTVSIGGARVGRIARGTYSTNTVSIGGARVGRIARGVPTVLIQFL